MSNYAIFFDYDNKTYRLPTNPEQITISSVQANSKYEILKSGQIAIPTHMELKEYSFECEFPNNPLHYVETTNSFKPADYYINLFKEIREDLKPIRFIASNGIGDEITSLVLIEDIEIVEKAGEEGDKYLSFSLLEYKEFNKKQVTVQKGIIINTLPKSQPAPVNPKSTGSYTVLSGDSLWSIAKKYYGDGSKFTKIVEANKDKIKNPSLIYPGQVLTIP